MALTDLLYNRTTTIRMHDGRRIMVLPDGEIIDIGNEKPIEAIPPEVTFTDSSGDTFTESEKLILEQLNK